MPKVIILSGISGQGKSTYAKARWSNALYLNADTIRGELCNGDMSDQSKNKQVFEQLHKRFETALEAAVDDILVDNTSLTFKDRNNYYKVIEKYPAYQTTLVYFEPRLADAIKQNAQRERKVPDDVIRKQCDRIEEPTAWERRNITTLKVR